MIVRISGDAIVVPGPVADAFRSIRGNSPAVKSVLYKGLPVDPMGYGPSKVHIGKPGFFYGVDVGCAGLRIPGAVLIEEQTFEVISRAHIVDAHPDGGRFLL